MLYSAFIRSERGSRRLVVHGKTGAWSRSSRLLSNSSPMLPGSLYCNSCRRGRSKRRIYSFAGSWSIQSARYQAAAGGCRYPGQLDWMIPISEAHLRAILKSWVEHYNRGRPHSSLGPGVPGPPNVVVSVRRSDFRLRLGEVLLYARRPCVEDCATSIRWRLLLLDLHGGR